MAKISIIVPIYNTADYLAPCIDSLLHQDLPPDAYEIILVNDGSTDGSAEICSRYAEAYPHILLVEQPNAGLSAARNSGLALAHGDWLWFVDSDDFVAPNCLRKIVQLCEAQQLEVLAISAANVRDGKREVYRQFTDNQQVTILRGVDFMRTRDFAHPVPTYIYNMRFWRAHDFTFMRGIFHEDNELLPRVLFFAERLQRCADICYFINCRNGSITRSSNPKKSYDLIKVARSLADFSMKYAQNGQKSADFDLFCNLIGNAFNGSLRNALQLTRAEQRQVLEAWCVDNRDLFSYMRRSARRLYRIEAHLFTHTPRLALCVYRMLRGSYELRVKN